MVFKATWLNDMVANEELLLEGQNIVTTHKIFVLFPEQCYSALAVCFAEH